MQLNLDKRLQKALRVALGIAMTTVQVDDKLSSRWGKILSILRKDLAVRGAHFRQEQERVEINRSRPKEVKSIDLLREFAFSDAIVNCDSCLCWGCGEPTQWKGRHSLNNPLGLFLPGIHLADCIVFRAQSMVTRSDIHRALDTKDRTRSERPT